MASVVGAMIVELGLNDAQFKSAMTKAQQKAKTFSTETQRYLKNIDNAMISLNKSNKLTNLFLGKDILSGSVGDLVRYADSYTDLGNRMRLVTSGSSELIAATNSVFEISLKTSQSLDATGQVYQRFAQNAQQLGISQAQVASLTETVSKAVAVSGASAASAQAALMQFGQSLASGIFRGQEFNSVMEQTPGLAQAIAKGLGVTTGELRQMANDGKLTMDVLIPALEKAKASVDKQFATRILTISAAFENLRTSSTKFIGEFDNAVGATSKLAQGLELVANNLDEIAAISIAGLSGGLAQKVVNSFKVHTTKLKNNLAELKSTEANTEAIFRQTAAEANLAKTQLATAQITRQKIANEIALNNAYMLSASTAHERSFYQAQATTLAQREAVAINNLTAAEARYTAEKIAATQATTHFAVAQRATIAGKIQLAKVSNLASFALRSAANGVKALGSVLAANPLVLVSLVGAGIWTWVDNTNEAKRKALEYADELSNIKDKLKDMDSISLAAVKAKAEESITAQQVNVKKLQKEYSDLNDEIKKLERSHGQVIQTGYQGYKKTIDNTAEMARVRGEAAKKAEALRDAEVTLANSTETAADVTQKFADVSEREMNEALDRMGIKLLDVESGTQKFNSAMLVASNTAGQSQGFFSGVADQLLNVDSAARKGAEGFYIYAAAYRNALLGKAEAPKITDENQKLLDKLQLDNAIDNTKSKSKWVALSVERALEGHKDLKIGDVGYDKIRAEYEAKFGKQWDDRNNRKSGKGTDYKKQYTDQLSDLQSRLSQLQADGQQIALFGEVSQYQEIAKLNADITQNAEKYAAFGQAATEELRKQATLLDQQAQKNAVAQFGIGKNRDLDQAEFEIGLIGKSRTQQEMETYGHQLDIEASRMKIGMSKENAALLDIEIQKLKERNAELVRQREEAKLDPMKGLESGIQSFGDSAMDVMSNVANITQNALDGMSDALTDFVLTGKADFRGLAQSIIKDITNMIIKMMIFNAIKAGGQAMGFDMSFMGGKAGGGLVYARGGIVGFDTGGYTGHGNRLTPAGIVHKGEYVLTKEATSRIGRDYLDFLNYAGGKGFANGGGVAVPKVPNLNIGSGSPKVSVKVINNGEPTQADVSTKQHGNELEITIALMDQIADQRYRKNQANDMRSGGTLSRM